MAIAEDFITDFQRKKVHYDSARHLVSSILEDAFRDSGIRAIVTSRIKNAERLKDKINSRNKDKNYDSIASIYKDVADLAGVRAAVYFPNDFSAVKNIILNNFKKVLVKEFPETATNLNDANIKTREYKKRFSGYLAHHYRIEMEIASHTVVVEVQVASVFMHAWSEVEHDLVYKPLAGALSLEEHEILDELNGLALAAEIALIRLKRSGLERVQKSNVRFRDPYELASFIANFARENSSYKDVTQLHLHDLESVFFILQNMGRDTAAELLPYLEDLDKNFEFFPLISQLIQKLLIGFDPAHEAWKFWYSNNPADPADADGFNHAVSEFNYAWMSLQSILQRRADKRKINVSNDGGWMRNAWTLLKVPYPQSVIDELIRFRKSTWGPMNISNAFQIVDKADEIKRIVSTIFDDDHSADQYDALYVPMGYPPVIR